MSHAWNESAIALDTRDALVKLRSYTLTLQRIKVVGI